MRSLLGSKPERIVTREYGRNSFLAIALWPLALALGRRGMENRQAAQALEMEKDAAEMYRRGYRVMSTQEYTVPFFSISYLKVTYELIDASRQDGTVR